MALNRTKEIVAIRLGQTIRQSPTTGSLCNFRPLLKHKYCVHNLCPDNTHHRAKQQPLNPSSKSPSSRRLCCLSIWDYASSNYINKTDNGQNMPQHTIPAAPADAAIVDPATMRAVNDADNVADNTNGANLATTESGNVYDNTDGDNSDPSIPKPGDIGYSTYMVDMGLFCLDIALPNIVIN
ncbi:hypothetical protein FN846DRAFT_891174 [Sphaerosporella brunnea]|uniref:Uncharacterized protein n=1 Tax=Sphaerosporella brunnea TaxID=1250544 RepID=A0A5J5EUC5_9PEZI|nr:hypothetical protein FN846DRAFT_891174 [Sphaerosporella brunnea]